MMVPYSTVPSPESELKNLLSLIFPGFTAFAPCVGTLVCKARLAPRSSLTSRYHALEKHQIENANTVSVCKVQDLWLIELVVKEKINELFWGTS